MHHHMVYENIWIWEGKTQKSQQSSVWVERFQPIPPDPFPTTDVIETTKIAILTETTTKFQEEMAKAGYVTTVTKIDANAWVEVRGPYPIGIGLYAWDHWLHMKADVYFESDKAVVGSPVVRLVLPVWALVLLYLVGIIAAALVLYGIGKEFIDSFLVEKQTITTHSPDCTTTTETIQKPSWIPLVMIGLGIVAAIIIIPKIIPYITRKK